MDANMKNQISFLLIVSLLAAFSACQKEPPKGKYRGTFNGSYTMEFQVVKYTTTYNFEITKSTETEVQLKEMDSKITSFLQKKSNDSIVGKIAFGKIYNPSQDGSPAINTIDIRGKYGKNRIVGTFSTTILLDDKQYLSEGDFVLQGN
jgi:hypothetical protein